jgi:hypothetical protein
VAERDQADAVAVGIGERGRRGQALARDEQLAVARGRRIWQGIQTVVDLDHAAERVVAVLLLRAAELQQVVERQPGLALPEG